MTATTVDQNLINQRIDEASGAIREIAAVANKLGQLEIERGLEESIGNLRHNNLRVLAFGEFNAGKSTLLNGMLGELTHNVPGLGSGAPLPTDAMPATAVLTSIVYGEEPRVLAYHTDGTVEPWDWEEFVDNAILEAGETENFGKFGHIKEFEVEYPSKLCAQRVTLIDAPGLNEDRRRDEITLSAVRLSDAALAIYRNDKFGGQSEQKYTSEMADAGLVETFRIMNIMNDQPINERFCRFVWARLVAPRFGDRESPAPATTPEELRKYRIYFVDALKAERAVKQRNPNLKKESGLPELMDDLFAFLTEERLPIFLERYSKQATKLGNDLEAVIDRTAQGLRQSRADLLHAIERVEPKRQELRRKQAEIPLIVERFRLMAEKDAVASHQHLVAGLIDELPGVLEHAELVEQREGFSAVLGVVDKLRAKPMAERASKIISAHLQDRIVAWAKNADGGLQTALIGDPSHPGAVPRMMAEIDQRVTEIEADLAGIAADVQGTSVGREHATVKEVGKIRKGIGIAIAAITGDPGMAAAGWAGDFKGMAISFGMLVGANIFLGPLIFAGPLGWAVLAGIVLFNVKRAQKIIEQNVKATVVRIYIEGDSAQNVVGLRDLTVRERPAIEQGVDTYFHTIEEIVTKEVGSAIKAQADEFEHLLDLSTDDLGKRDVELRRLDDFRDSLRAACNRLRNIQTEASQY